jgi:DNA-directed RNA polymerase subunit L
MEITSDALGAYTVVFADKDLDHAFGDAICNKLRKDARVERASHYVDFDSHKLEVVLREDLAAHLSVKCVLEDSVTDMISETAALSAQVHKAYP